MEIDVRNQGVTGIHKIFFSDYGAITSNTQEAIWISDFTCCNVSISVYKKDIDNLIKALEKAKEIWYS